MKQAALALLLLCIVAACGVLWLRHADATTQDRDAIASPASLQHWAGTDDLGRDRAARIGSALLFGLAGAVLVASMTTVITVAVALGIAFSPAAASSLLLYLSDAFLTLPWLFLLMLVRAALPLTLSAAVCAAMTLLLLAMLAWPVYVRGLSARLAALRDADWLLYARASGLTLSSIVVRSVVPHLRPLYLTQFLLCVPAAILAEADLGAVGFGMSDPLVSWGTLLKELGTTASVAASHWVYLPMALLLVILLCFEVLSMER